MVRRLGLSQARRLAVTGAALSSEQAVTLGLAHASAAADGVDAWLAETLAAIQKCEPLAVAYTKQLMSAAAPLDLGALLDRAATDFATVARGPRAMAGFQAFMQRKPPPWAEEG